MRGAAKYLAEEEMLSSRLFYQCFPVGLRATQGDEGLFRTQGLNPLAVLRSDEPEIWRQSN